MPAREGRCSAERFRGIVADIRAVCPPPKGMRVVFRRVPAKQLQGITAETSLDGRTFKIKIRSDLTEMETEDTAIHEYGHVLSWRPYHPVTSDHDAAWGVAFAEVYRAYNGTR